nr:hypothetical protein B0A51_01735 [Rachicladosporium sp. CCFEE 5018]
MDQRSQYSTQAGSVATGPPIRTTSDALPAQRGKGRPYRRVYTTRMHNMKLTACAADIQPKNILMNVVDNTPFTRYEEVYGRRPWPRKELDDRTIYASQPMMLTASLPKLCDLGEARKFKDCRKQDLLIPIMYRAPELILEMPWSYPVVIWAFGMTRRESALEGEEKVKLLKLMWKILQWRPQDRRSTEDIWDDEWFSTDLEAVKPETYAGLD